MPTLLDIAGISYSEGLVLDGESLWPKLINHGTKRDKPLVFCSGYQGAVIDMDYKLYYTKGKYELYNIAKDPGEKNDISAAEKMERLEKCLKESVEDYRRSFETGKTGDHLDWQDWWNIWK